MIGDRLETSVQSPDVIGTIVWVVFVEHAERCQAGRCAFNIAYPDL